MVNSAIGDHGNERHYTTPPHPTLVPLSLSLSVSLCVLVRLLYDLLCLEQDCGLCQAKPDRKDRNHSCVQLKAKQ